YQVALLDRAFRLGRIADVVTPDLLDRRFLLGVAEMQLTAALRGEAVDTAHYAFGAGEQGSGGAGQRAERGATDLHPVDGFTVGNGQVQLLATLDIGVPVRQLEIVVTAGQPRAVVDARPGGLGDAVGAFPHPLLEVLDVGELDLADRRGCRLQHRRRGAVPAVAMPPAALRGRGSFGAARFGMKGEGGHTCGIKHAVVDADLVEVAATQEVVAALHLVGR